MLRDELLILQIMNDAESELANSSIVGVQL